MIAEPTLLSRSAVQKENSAVDGTAGGAASHGGRNENRQKTVRGKRKARQGSENAKRKPLRNSEGSPGRAESDPLKDGEVESVTLFEVVSMGRSAMQAVVDDWVEAYILDRDAALLDLISFFIQCSGCKGVVTAEMLQNKQSAELLSKMVEDLDEGSGLQYKKFLAFPWILTVTWPMDMDSGDYPLIMSGLYWRRFRSHFCEFVSVLVAQCQYSVIFDSYLLSSLISLLTELSDSGVRAFRHTCTLAGVKLLSALASVALSLGVGVENSQRLCGVERAKTGGRRTAPRLERIQRKVTELQDKKLEIENMMDAIFKGVFLKRYRDVIPEIRAICMEELTVWMRLYSSVFLTDSHLKYMGWMMHDKQPDVRLKCVLGLQALYGDPHLSTRMDLFTVRFKERMVSMTLDKDHEVAVQAMRLLTVLSRSCEDALKQEDYTHMFQLVYSSHRALASAAGEFLFQRVLSEPALPVSGPGAPAPPLPSARLRSLLRFYTESQLHQHVVYLVDSLWDCAGALLKDWSSLTCLLLQPATEEQGLSDEEQGLMVELMLAVVRQAAEGPPLIGRGSGKKVISAKEKKCQFDDCVALTEHFVRVLPELLSKFSEDVEKVTALLKIPQFFHLDSCEEEHAEALLVQMGSAVDRHAEAELLEAAARSYQSIRGDDSPWQCPATAALDRLIPRWTHTLRECVAEALSHGTFQAGEGRTQEMLSALRRLTAFHNALDLSQCGLCEIGSRLLQVEMEHGGVPVEVMAEALRCVCCSVLWKLNTFGEVTATRELALQQRSQLRAFSEKCHRCLSHREKEVREQAFMCLCDVLIAQNYQLQMWDPAAGSPLLYTPDPKLQRALLSFILEHVFISTDQDSHSSRGGEAVGGGARVEELHRRRTLLAAYCKLIVHGVLEMSLAAEVFKQYMKHYNDFGDIIKETLNRTRQMDKMGSAHTLVLCLQQLFLRLKQEQDSGGPCGSGVQTFSSIKELARRFSLTFGWDQIKSRESLAMIHRDGIDFVFQGCGPQQSERQCPPNLSYLTILSEFSSRLLKPDKKAVLGYLQRCAAEQSAGSREESWLPLLYYRASLQGPAEGEDAGSFISSDTARPPPTPRSRSPSARHPPAPDGDMRTALPLPCVETKGNKPLRSQEEPKAAEPRPLDPTGQSGASVEDVNVDSVEIDL